MPSNSEALRPGSIIVEEAYALGKMMESNGWSGLLRNGITPSDVDLVFDNNGKILFCDFSIKYDDWERAICGQRWLYESFIKSAPHCAVLCKHSVKPDLFRKIDTLRDVERFQAMVWDFERVLSPIFDGAYWQRFVTMWVNEVDGPLKIRRHILGLNAGLVKATLTPPTE